MAAQGVPQALWEVFVREDFHFTTRIGAPSASEFDQTPDLCGRQAGVILLQFLQCFACVVTVDYGAGRVLAPRTMGLPDNDTLPGICSINSQASQSSSESGSVMAVLLFVLFLFERIARMSALTNRAVTGSQGMLRAIKCPKD